VPFIADNQLTQVVERWAGPGCCLATHLQAHRSATLVQICNIPEASTEEEDGLKWESRIGDFHALQIAI